VLGVAGQDLIDLINRQPAALAQHFGQGAGLGTAARGQVRQLRELVVGQ
jgi:hypothetical protein